MRGAQEGNFLPSLTVKSKPCIQNIPDQHVCESINEVCYGLLSIVYGSGFVLSLPPTGPNVTFPTV